MPVVHLYSWSLSALWWTQGYADGALGRMTVKVLPAPGVLATSIWPPWACANPCAMARPRPAPPASASPPRAQGGLIRDAPVQTRARPD